MPPSAPGARERAESFLRGSGEFRLGDLVTEAAHSRSVNLSQIAQASAADGLAMLFDVDRDVVSAFDTWSRTGQPGHVAAAVLEALRRGGRVFFTGCGATGRLSIQLDSIWRAFWQRRREAGELSPDPGSWEHRTRSVMAGGDYALIKAVEGFEDFAPFGRKQMADLAVAPGDVVFAITEGGETSFVIGTAWQGVDAGARVFFVYNNPDSLLRAHVRRSREVLDDPRIEKINLTTGAMAVAGSTRMQATSIQLVALLTVLEMVLRDLFTDAKVPDSGRGPSRQVPEQMREALASLRDELASRRVREPLADLVEAEERVYRAGARASYLASSLGVDVLTDTTERSPTYCTPAFRKWDDAEASDSWAFLFTPQPNSEMAWPALLHRPPQTIEWTEADLRRLLDEDAASRQAAVLREIGLRELMRFRIGLDGLVHRPIRRGDGVSAVVSELDAPLVAPDGGTFAALLDTARSAGAITSMVGVGRPGWIEGLGSGSAHPGVDHLVAVRVTDTPFLLDATVRTGTKLVMNALSTCTMVRLGRVLGNRMIRVVPSNLKLIDRAIRYIRDLAGVPYAEACHVLFEVMDYLEPRKRAGQTYPAPVGLAVMSLRHGPNLPEAEARLAGEEHGV